MVKLLKLLGRGVVTTLLLPFILVIWCLYGVYCLTTFVIMFFINVIEFFQGKNSEELIEDLEARKMLLEKEKADEKTKEMVNIMYQNALAQASLNQAPPVQQPQQVPPTPAQPFGPNVFNFPNTENYSQEEHSSSLNNQEETNNDNDAR